MSMACAQLCTSFDCINRLHNDFPREAERSKLEFGMRHSGYPT
ncbi:unnamed protein product [Haemonchus placei]|uniref:AraC family transcriptional regulator n=1 Tax=Haemonchus placei TaxID=6290 RepID=A0A0N4W6H1_HAEPC|nr:unnamed protein product [Haemonchus placei]